MKSTSTRTARKKQGRTRTFFRPSGGHEAAFFAAAEKNDQKECETCGKERDQRVQRSEAAGAAAPASGARNGGYISTLPGRGEALPASVQSFFSDRMGTDFSSVRVHHDTEAAESATDFRAQAYTVGDHIVFNRGKYAPSTDEGRKLMAHELTHVLQQRGEGDELQRVQMMPEETQVAATSTPNVDKKNMPTGEEREKEQEQSAETQGEKAVEPVSLPDLLTKGQPTAQRDFALNVNFDGDTEGQFDGGVGTAKNLRSTPAKGCTECESDNCVTVTGTLNIKYHVDTTVTLPDVPEGLTPCQHKRVADAIDHKIKPHEAQHVAAFKTYNGTVNLPIHYTGCADGLKAHVDEMHEADASAREAAARAQSAHLDPFHVSVDLDCDDPLPKK